MRKYVLREYCDKDESGSERVFDEKKDAVECALNELRKPSDSDKKVAIYTIEITPEQLEEYDNGNLDVTLSELATASAFPFDVFRDEKDAYAAVLKESMHDFEDDFINKMIEQNELSINTGRSGRDIAWLYLNDEEAAVYVDTLDPLTEDEIAVELQ